ncbi:hypothetical protein LS73_005565 [Helicobacter muridarum]|uniref:Anthranilate 1,2-dioxygenase large subunit n=1 Tax=Helicobacter muridarum TaxID=216 RepID=A0A099TY30_9HELI|nr:SRPBCC family protein [Helicobacter muridarum]TLE00156.1 hypothetical protein LS73_005565 [Helicobacter muridarum]STQ87038.1 Anthranilate 1,2-dioxygenase large subunit [Helicobacter muridarum]
MREKAIDYTSSKTMYEEFENLYKRFWHIGAHTSEIPNNRDYIILDIYDFQVVIYNDNGNIIAFNNTCPHRGARLIPNENKIFSRGNGNIICKYHGWKYSNKELHIPSRDGFCKDSIEGRDLLHYHVELCGELIFFSYNPAQSLKKQLGDFYDEFKAISHSIDSCVDINTHSKYEANWKISLENSIEGYHLPFVHSTTFMPLELEGLAPTDTNDVICSHSPMANQKIIKKYAKIRNLFQESNFYKEGYWCYHIFPFSFVASSFGLHYSIMLFYPSNNPYKTNFSSRTYSVKAKSKDVQDIYYKGMIQASWDILNEDTEVVALMQQGASKFMNFPNFVYHQNMENWIVKFHELYKKYM